MSGHGWITPNADGTKARCGGPGMCPECSTELGAPALRVKPIELRKPQITDPVHYVSHGTPRQLDGSQAFQPMCRAAIVTEVNDMDPVPEHGVPYVGLMVVNPTGQFFQRGVRYDSGAVPTLPYPEARQTSLGDPILCSGRIYRGGTWHWAGHA